MAPAAETARQGVCKPAARLALEQIRAWRPRFPEAFAKFGALFGQSYQTTAAADALFSRACHGHTPPCASYARSIKKASSSSSVSGAWFV